MTRHNFIFKHHTELGNKNSRSRDKSRTKGEEEGKEASLLFRHPRSQGLFVPLLSRVTGTPAMRLQYKRIQA